MSKATRKSAMTKVAACVIAWWLTAAPIAAQVAAASGINRLTVKALEAGEIIVSVDAVPQSAAGQVQAIVDIWTPPRQLWDMMIDCKRSLAINERLKHCKIVAADQQAKWDEREHVVAWPWPLPTVRFKFRSDYVAYSSIRFQKTEGDLKRLDGVWRLEPIHGGNATRLFYEATIDAGSPLPGFLTRSLMEGEVRSMLASMRAEATSRAPR